MMRLLSLFALFVLLVACDDYPRDPEHSWKDMQSSGVLKVGILHHRPWAVLEDGQASGSEVQLVQGFAAESGATPQWQEYAYRDGITALKEGRIQLLIGGLCDDMHAKDEVGVTRPYLLTKPKDPEQDACQHVMAVRGGENRFLVELERYLGRAEDKK